MGVVITILVVLFLALAFVFRQHPVIGVVLLALVLLAVVVFALVKKKKKTVQNPASEKRGTVNARLILSMGLENLAESAKHYVAFDFETTGLHPYTGDEIIEYAAVIFENGAVVNSFAKMAKPSKPIPKEASNINGISNAMVKGCQSTQDVAKEFYLFLKPYIESDYLLVAHNASFDIGFLQKVWQDNGIDAEFSVADTLEFEKQLHAEQQNYKLGTIANYYQLSIADLHRAEKDATLCGQILFQQIKEKREIIQARIDALLPLERDFIFKVHDILKQANRDVSYLSFDAHTSYITVDCFSRVLKAKLKGRTTYVIITAEKVEKIPQERISDASNTEGSVYKRFLINSANDLDLIREYIIESYDNSLADTLSYLDRKPKGVYELVSYLNKNIVL